MGLWKSLGRGNLITTTPPAEVSVLVQDARGKEFRIQLTDIQWKQWWLIHRRIPREILAQIVLPARFSGIEISKATNPQARYFFCDSLAFYTEELKPLTFQPQPKRNLQPYRDNWWEPTPARERLPFPTREETILPSNFEKEFQGDGAAKPGLAVLNCATKAGTERWSTNIVRQRAA